MSTTSIIQSFLFWCHSQNDCCLRIGITFQRIISYIIMLYKFISKHHCISSNTAHTIEEDSLMWKCVMLEIMCKPGNQTSGNSCSKEWDVTGEICIHSASSAVHQSYIISCLFLNIWRGNPFTPVFICASLFL